MHPRCYWALLACGLLAGTLAFGFLLRALDAEGQVVGGIVGAGEAGTVDEQLIYKTLKGETRRVNLQRLVIKVPASYGQILTTAGGDSETLWFVDKNGTLRNVILGRRLVRLEREEAGK